MQIKIYPNEIIKLFDEKKDEYKNHISPIIGLIGEDFLTALFQYYLESIGRKVEILNGHPTKQLSNRRSKNLDRWILVNDERGKRTLYQTEIKNWTAYSIGGFSLNADKRLSKKTNQNWDRFVELLEKEDKLRKVILKMNRHNDISKQVKIAPLLLYWLPMFYNKRKCFFEYKIKKPRRSEFNYLYIFSGSSFLREYVQKNGNKPLILKIGNATEVRLRILKDKFHISC